MMGSGKEMPNFGVVDCMCVSDFFAKGVIFRHQSPAREVTIYIFLFVYFFSQKKLKWGVHLG